MKVVQAKWNFSGDSNLEFEKFCPVIVLRHIIRKPQVYQWAPQKRQHKRRTFVISKRERKKNIARQNRNLNTGRVQRSVVESEQFASRPREEEPSASSDKLCVHIGVGSKTSLQAIRISCRVLVSRCKEFFAIQTNGKAEIVQVEIPLESYFLCCPFFFGLHQSTTAAHHSSSPRPKFSQLVFHLFLLSPRYQRQESSPTLHTRNTQVSSFTPGSGCVFGCAKRVKSEEIL